MSWWKNCSQLGRNWRKGFLRSCWGAKILLRGFPVSGVRSLLDTQCWLTFHPLLGTLDLLIWKGPSTTPCYLLIGWKNQAVMEVFSEMGLRFWSRHSVTSSVFKGNCRTFPQIILQRHFLYQTSGADVMEGRRPQAHLLIFLLVRPVKLSPWLPCPPGVHMLKNHWLMHPSHIVGEEIVPQVGQFVR